MTSSLDTIININYLIIKDMSNFRSGEEGIFPSLLLAAEERLRQIKPDASILNRNLCYAQKSSDFPDGEYEDVFGDISVSIQT